MTPCVYPYHYGMLWEIAVSGPLAASELRAAREWGVLGTGNRLRALVKLDLLERNDGIYSLTDKGRAWMAVEWRS